MRPINYQLTNPLVNKLINLENQRTLTNNYEITPELLKNLHNIQNINNIFHLSHLLGLNLTLKESEKFLQGRFDVEMNKELTLLKNFRNTIEYVRSNNYDNSIDILEDTFQHINKLLILDIKEHWESKFRNDLNLDQSFDDWLKFNDDSVLPADVKNEVNKTFEWYRANSQDINAIIRIAVVVYRMIRIVPFTNFNKLSIISLTDFLLQKEGYLKNAYISIPKIFDINKEIFEAKWSEALNSPTGNITFWIETFIEAVIIEYMYIEPIIKTYFEQSKKKVHQPFLNLNKRQLKILKYLQTIPSVKREDYVQMFDVSTMTAYRDLLELLKKKLIKLEGQGRATRYFLANR